MPNRCTYSDLTTDACAHCRGNVHTDLDPTPATTTPTPGRVVWSPTKARHDAQDATTAPRRRQVRDSSTVVIQGPQNANTCRCGRPVHNNAVACDHCADQLAQALGDIDALDNELETTITKQRAAALEGGSRSANNALPWHEKAADARRNLHALLVSWVRLCHEEGIRHQSRSDGLPDNNLPALSTWLLWRVDGLTHHEAAADAVDQITHAVAHCHRLIDRRPDREFVGPCECGRDLYRKPNAPIVTCTTCGNEYEADAMLDWMRHQVMGRYVTAREGAGLLGKFGLPIKQGTIDKWHERGLLQARGHDLEGRRRTYLLDDLMALAARTTRQGA